jgi:Flp pilus assembly protein TadG
MAPLLFKSHKHRFKAGIDQRTPRTMQRILGSEAHMRRFWSNRDGNFAMMFAIAIVPIIGAMGVAVDYSLASSYRTDVQKALDTTALALAKIMPADQATLDSVGMQYFTANMGPHTLSDLALEITPDLGTVHIRASGFYSPRIANILGVSTVPLSTESRARWSIGQVEVVLALDNTGSMAGEKIVKLREGAQKLVDILKQAVKKAGDAKIAVVPYTVQVRVDHTAYSSATWHFSGYCSRSQYKNQTDCNNNSGIWKNVSAASWTGCIADRDRKNSSNDAINNDVKDIEAGTDNDTKFPRAPFNSGDCPAATILPLTDVYTSEGYTALTNKISAMAAQGNTNVTIGAAWGWHMLDDKIPFTDARPYNTKDLQKYLILMTDGDNTENRFQQSESAIDDRTEMVCANIKALPKNTANNPSTTAIKVWTIRVMNGDAALLKACATNDDMYVNVTDPNQLFGVFSSIGSEIAALHLAK